MGGQEIGKLDLVSYLGSVIDVQEGADADVKARIGKARQSCIYFTEAYMDPARSRKETSLRTKLKLYNSNVKTVLLETTETWKTTQEIVRKRRAVICKCFCFILGIR